jgi:hypothetical protein
MFVIAKTDGTTDIGFDTDINAANMPSGFSYYRWIGYIWTDASANIVKFTHSGDLLYFTDLVALPKKVTGFTATSWTQVDLSAIAPMSKLIGYNIGAQASTSVANYSVSVALDSAGKTAIDSASDNSYVGAISWNSGSTKAMIPATITSPYLNASNGGSHSIFAPIVRLARGSNSGGGSTSLWAQSGSNISYSSGNVGIGSGNFGTDADNVLSISSSTAPTSSITDGIQLFAVHQTTGGHELRVRDELGYVTTLSPHNFSTIPGGPSEELAWSYYSEKNDKSISVDMTRALRLIEDLTGEKLIYITDTTTGQELLSTNIATLPVIPLKEQIASLADQSDEYTTILTNITDDITMITDEIETITDEANARSDLIETLQTRMDAVDAGLSILEVLGATDLTKLETLLAIDPEQLVYMDGDATLDDLTVMGRISAGSIAVGAFTVTNDPDAPIVGTGVIEQDAQSVDIATEAVVADSHIFTSLRGTESYILRVETIEEGVGFTVSTDDTVTEDIMFDWFIVGEDQKEEVPIDEEEVSQE